PACARSAPPAGPAPPATASGDAGSAPPATASGDAGSAPPATASGDAGSAPPARPQEQARSMQPARAEPRERTAQPAQSTRPARPEQITWSYVQWRDIMAKLARPQALARFRAVFPDLADWLESPWTGPPPFLPGLDPENDIEVTVEGRILTIRAERREQDNGPCRSEFRYGSLARAVRLPARVDAADVTARYDKGVLEV